MLFTHRPFLFYLGTRSCTRFATQIAAVEVYELTGSAFDLGMIGLVQFVPSALVVFVAGHAADHYDRRWVIALCQLVEALTAAYLALGTFGGWISVPGIFIAMTVLGLATGFESPAIAALLPGVVPEGEVQRGTAISTGAAQVVTITGPAVGGLAYAVAPSLPYVVMLVLWLLGALLAVVIVRERAVVSHTATSLKAVFAGVSFVRHNPAILGTISLDLFAVLLGGAVALLPIYASDILDAGPWGLGLLRAAPAVGALLMTAVLTRFTIETRVGMRMFQAVIVFGVATIVFAVSTAMWLSILALAVMGAADTVSVVIRFSLVQLATPDDTRGRVGAVNFLFINASNQLGQFESGVTAALLGTVPAAVLGGVGTIAVALLWMKLFPTLRKVERLE